MRPSTLPRLRKDFVRAYRLVSFFTDKKATWITCVPLIVQMGLATQKQVDALHRQQCYEMNMLTFQAILPVLTLWGTKR